MALHSTVVQTGGALRLAGLLTAALLLAGGLAMAATPKSLQEGPRWIGPDGQPLPFASHEQVKEFLLTATVVESKRIGQGVNNPRKVLLEKDGVQAHAVFRDVHVEKYQKTETGAPVLFRDDALFEVAAYELGLLLGLDCVPPAVERHLFGTRGSLQLWIEKATSELKRRKKEIVPPDERYWRLQLQLMRVFDGLIRNEDRNQGNMLFDSDWKLWLIDHTRAFRRKAELVFRDDIWFCEKRFFDRLREVTDEQLAETLSPYLYGKEVKGVLRRRTALVERLEGLIAKRGAQVVLFELQPDGPPKAAALAAVRPDSD